MLQGLELLGQAYLSFLNPLSLAYGLGGALLGIIVGCMPGLSATLCIALLTTLTIKLPANSPRQNRMVQGSKGSRRVKNGAVLQAMAAATTGAMPRPRSERWQVG